MATEIKVADLVAEIKFRDEKFKRELTSLRRNVDKRTDQMVGEFKKVERKGLVSFKRLAVGAASALGGILAFVAARGLFRGFKRIVSLASDTTESMNKVKEVFGKAAVSVIKFSNKAAVSLGASKEEALAMTGEIGNLLVAMGSTEEVAAKMSTDILQLAADLGSFNNVPTTQALNAIRAALIGETEPMRRFGSNVSAARIETLALAKGIDKGTLATNEMMKAQLRLEIIFKDTKKAQGDFARTSNDFANLMKTLVSLFSDAAAELGTALIPKITELAREVKTFVTSTKFEKLVTNLATGFGVLADKIGEAVKSIVAWITVTNKSQTFRQAIDDLKEMKVGLTDLKDELNKLSFGDFINFPEGKAKDRDLIRKILGKDAEINLANVGAAIVSLDIKLKNLQDRVDAGKSLSDLVNSPKPPEKPLEVGDVIPGGTGSTGGVVKKERKAPTSKTPIDELTKTLKRLQDEADKTDEALSDSLDEAADAAKNLDNELKGVAEQLGSAIRSGEDFLKVLVRIALQKLALQFTGPVGIAAAFVSSLFGQGGGGKVGQLGHIQAATGLSGKVPQGFSQDNFLIGVKTGEEVDIKTPAQAFANDRGQLQLVSAVQALSANVSLIRSEQQDIIAMVSIEDREVQLLVEKAQRRDLRFRG